MAGSNELEKNPLEAGVVLENVFGMNVVFGRFSLVVSEKEWETTCPRGCGLSRISMDGGGSDPLNGFVHFFVGFGTTPRTSSDS